MHTSQSNSLFAKPLVFSRTDNASVTYLSSPHELPAYSRCVGEWLVKWADETPDSVFLADRNTPDSSWREVTYRQFLEKITSLAGWLLDRNGNCERPIAVLSENSIDHALLAFAGMHVGIPVATISIAYSLLSTDHEKLKEMVRHLDPGLIYVSDMGVFGKAVDAISNEHTAILLASSLPDDNNFDAVLFSDASNTENADRVVEQFEKIGPDTIARLLFTSGSTGTPKAVINTQRMLTSNQEANLVLWPFLKTNPPIIVDWLPWSHTFGANFTMNVVLRNGGAMYIDDGKPAPPLIHKTVQNIKEIKPTMCFNVPRGYEMLVGELESDSEFREVFFNMDLIFYAAAALPQSTWDHLQKLSVTSTGKAVPMVAAWGSTETAPLATSCYFQADSTGNIGLPVPGTVLKLVSNGDKMEVRVKGPNVTPGYYKLDDKTRDAFDEEGYYIMGDAVRFADPAVPEKGLFFDGRVSEDFKLSSGTWVSVGELRIAGIDALAPLAQDIVVTGHDKNDIGFLIFPNEPACRKMANAGDDVPIEDVLGCEPVIAHMVKGLNSLKETGGGTSKYANRVRFLTSPASPDMGEITDKAYLNQQQILKNRAHDVALLQGEETSAFIEI